MILSVLIRRFLSNFGEGLLIETFGMLLDVLVIGIIILWLNEIRDKKRRRELEIQRYQEEIDDFRGWDEKEATFRIVGNIRRLNKRGVSKIDLSICYLEEARLSHCNLQAADLWAVNLQKADLREANLNLANLNLANLQKADLRGANFSGADLIGANLNLADLRRANLREANFRGANLREANFSGADLIGANLNLADLNLADLRRADLRSSNLQNADLSEANFQGAWLRGAYLSEADLQRTMSLDAEQLSEVKTLYKAKLDPDLEKEIQEKFPHLLEKPDWIKEADEGEGDS